MRILIVSGDLLKTELLIDGDRGFAGTHSVKIKPRISEGLSLIDSKTDHLLAQSLTMEFLEEEKMLDLSGISVHDGCIFRIVRKVNNGDRSYDLLLIVHHYPEVPEISGNIGKSLMSSVRFEDPSGLRHAFLEKVIQLTLKKMYKADKTH